MRVRFRIGNIVDRDDLEIVRVSLQYRSQALAANAPEAIDANMRHHG
jgi:hypothetical protein